MTDVTHLLQRAAQALQAGDLANAERSCRAALKASPHHPGALHLLGLVAKRAGYVDAAVDLFRQAVAKAPGYVEAWTNLGRALGDQGKAVEATRRAGPRTRASALTGACLLLLACVRLIT